MTITFYTLLTVLLLIAFRQVLGIPLAIWMIMFAGSVFVLITGQLSWIAAWHALNFQVLGYLLGMFILAEALEQSGYLAYLTEKIFKHSRYAWQALLLIVLVMGCGSALLMNDTLAIVGAPVVLLLCRHHPQLQKPLLLALAFSITTGSVMSPVGNPQNLLIALSGNFVAPFVSFVKTLWLPTFLNLLITILYLLFCFRNSMFESVNVLLPNPIRELKTARLARLSLIIFIILLTTKIIVNTWYQNMPLPFGVMSLLAVVPILTFSPQRFLILKKLDWGAMIFFVAMFILMKAVVQDPLFANVLVKNALAMTSYHGVLTSSLLLSQLISNVPLVALYLPVLQHLHVSTSTYLSLAVGSTLAGNLFIFGAASNVIIMHNVERRKEHVFGFWKFAVLGIPLTVMNVLVYLPWLL